MTCPYCLLSIMRPTILVRPEPMTPDGFVCNCAMACFGGGETEVERRMEQQRAIATAKEQGDMHLAILACEKGNGSTLASAT